MAPIQDSDKLQSDVDKYISTNDVMIFSKSWCTFCVEVKELFDSLGLKYFSLELDTLENGAQMQDAMASRAGRSTVPQVFIRGQHVGGCDDTLAAHKSGKLLELVNFIP